MDQHTLGKWLINGTKRRKDSQLQSLELPCRILWYVEMNALHITDFYWMVYTCRGRFWVHGQHVNDDVIKWKHFTRYWPFVWGIDRSSVNSSHKGQWRGALVFSFICARINGWVSNREAGDLKRHRAHYDDIAMNLGDACRFMCCP